MEAISHPKRKGHKLRSKQEQAPLNYEVFTHRGQVGSH